MASITHDWTVADLLDQFGAIPVSRIRLDPAPGTATEQHVVDIESREDRLYELIDGVLLEKTIGFYESYLAGLLIQFLGAFAREHDLGIVAGADGTLKILPEQVRIPDVSFVSWDRLPNRQLPAEPIPQLAPDLIVEVISKSNTRKEMDRKLREYFQVDVRLVWYVYPDSCSVSVYTGPDKLTELTDDAILDGGDVLPGFALPLAQLFAKPQQTDPN
ncbi:MAG: Uma2 family endonuclease [Planctomycetes bacterium]|nr:Uma2 family endonuclease [Planctomycetota bacterium]